MRVGFAATLLVGLAVGFQGMSPAAAASDAAEAGKKKKASVWSRAPTPVLQIGAEAPLRDVKLRNVDGNRLSLNGAAGKRGTLVIFTCNHCPYVKAWQDRIVALGNKLLGDEIGVVALNSNTPAVMEEDNYSGMQARAKALGMQYPYVVDRGSKLARAFGAKRTPEAFLFDAQWKLVYHGAIDDNASHPESVQHAYLADAAAQLRAGKAVVVPETRFFGCSIKFYE